MGASVGTWRIIKSSCHTDHSGKQELLWKSLNRIDVISLPRCSRAGGLFSIAEDQVTDTFIIAFDLKLFQNRFARLALKLLLGAMHPAACHTEVRRCVHHIAHRGSVQEDNVGVDHVDFHTFYNSWTAEGDTICKAIRSGNNWYYDVPCDLSGYKVRIMDVRVYDAAGNQTLNASGYPVTNARLKYDKVTFDLAGGNCSESSRDVLYARCHLDGKTDTYVSTYGKLKALPTPTKTGYTFAGWYTDASGGTRVTDSTAVTSESNHTLYARWTPVTYAVTYNANAGSDTVINMPTNQTKTYGVDLTLSGNTPKREGYIFLASMPRKAARRFSWRSG